MSYRVRRKTTSTTFTVQGQLCKVFLEPMAPYAPGFWLWNVGFAIGKSPRQLNDWYRRKKNKRARSINNQLLGKSGIKTIAKGFDTVLVMRWNIAPGDAIVLDCTSANPEKQFRAWQHWHKHHQDWVIDYERKEFFWYRPPYVDDIAYQLFRVVPKTPLDLRQNCLDRRYYECFDVAPKGRPKLQPK